MEKQRDGHQLIGLTGRSICPCVQSNPHQGQLLKFLPMELLSKHKLWINFKLSEGGMGSLMSSTQREVCMDEVLITAQEAPPPKLRRAFLR